MVDELSFLQNKLRESEAELKNAQQIAHIGSLTCDPATGQMTFSDEMFRICGLDPQSNPPAYQDLRNWIHPDERGRLDSTIRNTLETGKEFELELHVTLNSGVKRILLSRGHARRRDKSEGRLLVATLQDITERKQGELALFRANEKLNMLSSITRHDVLNNTTGLLGLVDMLNELITDSSALALIKDIRSLIRTINDQILFTRFYQDIGVKAPEWQDVREIICDAARQLRPEGVVIDNSIQGIEVYADTLIGKVFYNLMENSLRHGEHVKNMSFAASETGQGLLITYEDDGVGVSDEDKQKLFQKGFGKHTGLGLFLSKEILAITGIGIRENGVRGKGVRFEILVPKGSYLFKDVE